MGGRLDEGSSKRQRRSPDYAESSGTSSKRRRRNAGSSSMPPRKQHLYLALDDWEGGYSIHKLDADNIFLDDIGGGGEHRLPEPTAIRIKTPVYGRMIFTALGTTIFIDTNPHNRGDNVPPTFVYDTDTAALTVGPRIPRGIDGLSTFMAARETLYALTTADSPDPPCLQALSWGRTATEKIWEPGMDWSGSRVRSSRPRGQGFFDAELDAWVGIDRKEAGYVCCCQVASRSATARRPPERRVLEEKLFRFNNEENYMDGGRYMKATLTYMGGSRFCLVENISCSEDAIDDGAVLHVTL
ncbi:hypothetical protein ACQ4PT_059019 [Festuca glaucescens]